MMSNIKFYKSRIINWKSPVNDSIFQHFKRYKQDHSLPTTIGRDVPYHRPSDAAFAGLHHVHLGQFNEKEIQFYRCSDDHLVYAKGMFTHAYLLIDILTPDAHQKANSIETMMKYIELANQFRDKL